MTGISHHALIELLNSGQLPISVEENRIFIDVSTLSTQNLIDASIEAQNHLLEPYRQLFVAKFAEVICDSIDELIDEALETLPTESS